MICHPEAGLRRRPAGGLTSVRATAEVWLRPESMHRRFNPESAATVRSHRKVPLSPASVRVRDDNRGQVKVNAKLTSFFRALHD